MNLSPMENIMIRTILAIIGLVTLILWLLSSNPAQCDDCFIVGIPCYGPGACGENCTCIQPNGMGSRGWCN
jgi:hypothetical protein